MPASIAATDLPSISCDQLDQLKLATDPTDPQLIHEVITSKPLQEEGLRATDPTDLLIDHLSEKIENQNVTDCVKFVKFAADQVATLYTEFSDRTAIAPNLAKILLAAERKGGAITIRDAQLAFSQKFRPNAQMVRSWFSELAILGYGQIQKSKGGKTWIFENTPRSVDQIDQLLSNPMPASITATDLPSISCDQLDQLELATDPTDPQLIHEVITSKPLQEEGLRATDPTDLLIDHLSEKIENQNVTDCVKFVKFAADQVASLYTEFSDRSALAPNLAKILLAAERKGGKISVRDAQLAFTPKFRPNAQMARSWFGELVALNYGAVKNSGKSLIFEITAKSTDQLSTIASNSISVNISSSTVSEPTMISCLQSPTATVDTVDEMIHSRLQSEPIQGENSRSIVDDDLLFATSEKIENQKNVSDCVKFICTANCKTAPKLNFEFESHFTNNFCWINFRLRLPKQVPTSHLTCVTQNTCRVL